MSEPSMYGRFPVQFALIDENAQANNEIVAAVSGKRIRVVSFFVVAAAANSITWKSATTAIAGPMALAQNGGVSAEAEVGLCETAMGEALNLALSAATQVGGGVAYTLT